MSINSITAAPQALPAASLAPARQDAATGQRKSDRLRQAPQFPSQKKHARKCRFLLRLNGGAGERSARCISRYVIGGCGVVTFADSGRLASITSPCTSRRKPGSIGCCMLCHGYVCKLSSCYWSRAIRRVAIIDVHTEPEADRRESTYYPATLLGNVDSTQFSAANTPCQRAIKFTLSPVSQCKTLSRW